MDVIRAVFHNNTYTIYIINLVEYPPNRASQVTCVGMWKLSGLPYMLWSVKQTRASDYTGSQLKTVCVSGYTGS